MAPEQAKGKIGRQARRHLGVWRGALRDADRPARCSAARTIPETLAARDDARESILAHCRRPRRGTSRTLLARCLVKDPKQRLRDIGEARSALDGAFETATPQTTAAATPASPRRTIAIASATLLGGAAVATLATWALMRPTPVPLQPMRFAVAPTGAQALAISGVERDFVLSADGRHLVYVAGGGQLMVRAIEALDPVPLRGITGALNPFLSPDGRWVGYFTGHRTPEGRDHGRGAHHPVPHRGHTARRELGTRRLDRLRDERSHHRPVPRPSRGRDADRADHARCRAGRSGSSVPVPPAQRAGGAVHRHLERRDRHRADRRAGSHDRPDHDAGARGKSGRVQSRLRQAQARPAIWSTRSRARCAPCASIRTPSRWGATRYPWSRQ